MHTKSFVGWGFALDPNEGAFSAPPCPLAVFRGPILLKGGEGKGEEERGGTEFILCPRKKKEKSAPM